MDDYQFLVRDHITLVREITKMEKGTTGRRPSLRNVSGQTPYRGTTGYHPKSGYRRSGNR